MSAIINEVKCRKCRRTLGHLDDGILVAGGVRLYGHVRVFCDFCGRPYTYIEALPKDDLGHPEGALEIINGLGKDYSKHWIIEKEREKRKKLDDNS